MNKSHIKIVLLKTLKISWRVVRFFLLVVAAIIESTERKKYQPTLPEIVMGEKIFDDIYYIPDEHHKK